MKPILFYFSPTFYIPSFSFMLMMASLVATTVAYKMAPRRGLSQIAVLDLSIIGTLAALVGGRLFHVFVEAPDYYWQHPSHVYQIWRGGFVSYGAFIGLGIGWTTYLKIKKLDTLTYLDHMCLFAGPFIDFFVRMGCLLAGCCHGTPSSFDKFEYLLYIKFHHLAGDSAHYNGVGLWPTQIYSMTVAVLIFGICFAISKRQKFKGQVMLSFLILYAIFRTAIEFLRGDLDRGVYFGGVISTAQITSLISVGICLTLYVIFRKKYPLVPKNPS